MLRRHRSRRSRGGFPLCLDRKTAPASRSAEASRDLLIARPPLLAVMQGGECAAPKHTDTFSQLHRAPHNVFVQSPRDRIYRELVSALLGAGLLLMFFRSHPSMNLMTSSLFLSRNISCMFPWIPTSSSRTKSSLAPA